MCSWIFGRLETYKNVAETSAWSFTSGPGFTRPFCPLTSLQRPDSRLKDEIQNGHIVLNYSKAPSNPFPFQENEFPPKSQSEFREVDFGIFMEEFKECLDVPCPFSLNTREQY